MVDTRNTDNAWFETFSLNYHDEDGSLFHRLKPQALDAGLRYEWAHGTSALPVREAHLRYLGTVITLFHCTLLMFISDRS